VPTAPMNSSAGSRRMNSPRMRATSGLSSTTRTRRRDGCGSDIVRKPSIPASRNTNADRANARLAPWVAKRRHRWAPPDLRPTATLQAVFALCSQGARPSGRVRESGRVKRQSTLRARWVSLHPSIPWMITELAWRASGDAHLRSC
jgi:hypothetical protein